MKRHSNKIVFSTKDRYSDRKDRRHSHLWVAKISCFADFTPID